MTCIVALRSGDAVYMGADSASTDGWVMYQVRDPKIFRVGRMLIGFTSSWRMGQLLGHSLTLPEHHGDVPADRYMATSFIDAVRECLKRGGWAKKENEVEKGGAFLVGYQGRIFHVDDDYHVGESVADFDAVGSGYMIALGSLHTSAAWHDPIKRVNAALEAASSYCATVRGPFTVRDLVI
jgi:ATP-dependent protease HslVU (ClpYQ) peptidase subunit